MTMRKILIYIHGMGGSPAEIGHWRPFFPDCAFFAPEYTSIDPIDGGRQIGDAVREASKGYDTLYLIANSIGAFLALHAGIDGLVSKAYFISPVVDMERMIADGLTALGATEEDLRKQGSMRTPNGVELSWDYLRRLRAHPVSWRAPTEILYGGADALVPFETVRAFAEKTGARISLMEGGEHWFHTKEQMDFLDDWIKRGQEEGR